MKSVLEQRPIQPSLLIAVVIMLVLVVIPHVWNLNIWITGFFFLSAILRLAVWYQRKKLPNRWVLMLLVFVALINLFLHVDYTNGRAFGVAMLVAMLGLKLLELKDRRGLYITVFLGYFLIITQFLFDQSMMITLYLLIPTLGLSSLLHAANCWNKHNDKVDFLYSTKKSAFLIVSSIPLMLVLYVLFPRMDGPLWSFHLDMTRNTVGISDSLEPGNISSLSQSTAKAFRVEFESTIPERNQLYWRGLTLWRTDGHSWKHEHTTGKNTGSVTAISKPLKYIVTMEATEQRWMFPLDRLIEYNSSLNLNEDYELTSKKQINKKHRFSAISAVQYSQMELTGRAKRLGLQLPDNITERMRDLVKQWQASSDSDKEVVESALRHFNQQPFIYTLQPPKMLINTADQFLFDFQKGFCEHYSSSFVLLMRLAGIPSRIVVGYLGGEINPLGGHMIVKQSDAHAWAEVWLPENGWTRVDPTAAVAPERVEQSINIDASQSDAMVTFQIEDNDFTRSLMRQLNWFADNLDLQWNRWVIGYNKNRQKSLLENLGLSWLTGYKQAMATVIGGIVIIALVALVMLRDKRLKLDPVRACYEKFIRKLARAGFSVSPAVSPTDVYQLSRKQFPEQAADILAIISLYNQLRYGPSQSQAVIKNLKRRVSLLKLKHR